MSAAPSAVSSRRIDPAEIAGFVNAAFRYAPADTYASLRAFDQFNHKVPPVLIRSVAIGDAGLQSLIDAAVIAAQDAADAVSPAVFAPPIATFSSSSHARSVDLAGGLTLSVEVDENPAISRQRLEALIGPATVVVESGSVWADPETGELQPKIHIHWRLSEATEDREQHDLLRQARSLAMRLIGADPTGVPVVHPLRWPGTWNLKAAPVMAVMVALNEAAEIHLDDALDRLQDAIEAAGIAEVGVTSRAPGEPTTDPRLVAAWMNAIPNGGDNVHYGDWISVGYACHNAVGGDAGFQVWDQWSRKSVKYDAAEQDVTWRRIVAACSGPNPPRRIGAGTLCYQAKQAGWTWTSQTVRIKQAWKEEHAQAEPSASDAAAPSEPQINGHDLTEDGIALAFAEIHKDQLRFDHTRGAWFQWTGTYWRQDETKLGFSWARDICRRLVSQEAARLAEHSVKTLGKVATAAAVERFAAADQTLSVTSTNWDRDPFLLGTPGGTVDLQTGEIREPSPQDHITRLTAVAPAAVPHCRQWLAFLRQATNSNDEMIRFLRQWCGYSLTGDTREHAVLFIYGPGGNGKSVFLNTVAGIAGAYVRAAPMDSFTVATGDRHPTDMAMLAGARMVTASETEEGRAWAEARIKALTGGDPIAARFMRQNFFEFTPQFKLTIVGNHKPVLRNVDDAARRRFNIVPFVHKPETVDRELEAKLRQEWPEILRWMIEGCLDWQKNGLVRPKVVTDATAEYFSEQDSVGQWVDECCSKSPTQYDTTLRLFESWTRYALASGEKPGTKKWFSQTMARLGFEPLKDVPGDRGRRGFGGIAAILTAPKSHHEPADPGYET